MLGRIGLLGLAAAIFATTLAAAEPVFVPADDQRLTYSDYLNLAFVDSPARPGAKLARFSRPLDMPQKGYGSDNPGARLRFRTNSASVTVELFYNSLHVSKSARNPRGVYFIDGQTQPGWTFATQESAVVRPEETVKVALTAPAAGAHDYELVMPYGDSTDVAGVWIEPGAELTAPTPRPAFRLLMYGDSITHGFTAADVTGSYTFKTAQLKNWQLLNLGLGGRASTVADGTVLGGVECDLVTVLLGVNDWQAGRPVEAYKKNMAGFIAAFRAKKPQTPIYFLTPLWVPESWQPKTAKQPLEERLGGRDQGCPESFDRRDQVDRPRSETLRPGGGAPQRRGLRPDGPAAGRAAAVSLSGMIQAPTRCRKTPANP